MQENHCRETREGTLRPTNLSTKRQWIAEMARANRDRAFSSLHHVIDMEWMRLKVPVVRHLSIHPLKSLSRRTAAITVSKTP
jgi:hypothetical protein